MWKKQLIALNLALLLLGLTSVPALATGPGEDVIPYVPPEGEVTVDNLPRLPALPCWTEEGDLTLQDSTDTPYLISVGGTSFWSDQDTTGDRWSYRAENHALTLTGYNGGTINASGDLTVYAQNNVTITGSSGGNYGGGGILVDGTFMLIVQSGSVSINGGDGRARGGDAIYANVFNYVNFVGTASYFFGGDATSTVYADEPFGGCGINAGFIMLLGTGRVYAYGGDVSYSSITQAMGGYGVLSDTVYIESDCTIQGGSGYFCGPGICFLSYCQFGVVNASVICTGSVGYAIYNPDGEYWYYSKHTTAKGTDTRVTITPNSYRLRLYGNAGNSATLPSGATWTSLTAYYPTGYDLTDYIFQRPGYVQLAWTGTDYSSSDPLPLNAYFTPATNCSLYAYWTKADPGDIILNALSGRLTGGSFYLKTSGIPVTLPNQVTYEDESSLLGWSTSLETDTDSAQFFPGQWYEGGDVVSPAENAATILYAREPGTGQYILYHPTQGTVTAGGTVLVQGSVASYPDLLVYAPDGSRFTPPENYVFAGWSTSEGSTAVDIAPGETVQLTTGDVLHLYAVWKPESYTYTPAPGLTVTSIPSTKTIQVTVTDTWAGQADYTAVCALYEGDKMIDCAISSAEGKSLELQYQGDTPPLCKVFALGKDWQPLRACTSYTPAK